MAVSQKLLISDKGYITLKLARLIQGKKTVSVPYHEVEVISAETVLDTQLFLCQMITRLNHIEISSLIFLNTF